MESIKFSVETKQVITTKEIALDLPVCLKNDFSSSHDEHYFVYIDENYQATLISYDLTYNHYKIELINYFDQHHQLTDFIIQDFPKTCRIEEFCHHFDKATKAINDRLDAFNVIKNMNKE